MKALLDLTSGEKFIPEMVILQPPPIEPEIGETPLTIIWYENLVEGEGEERPTPETNTMTSYYPDFPPPKMQLISVSFMLRTLS